MLDFTEFVPEEQPEEVVKKPIPESLDVTGLQVSASDSGKLAEPIVAKQTKPTGMLDVTKSGIDIDVDPAMFELKEQAKVESSKENERSLLMSIPVLSEFVRSGARYAANMGSRIPNFNRLNMEQQLKVTEENDTAYRNYWGGLRQLREMENTGKIKAIGVDEFDMYDGKNPSIKPKYFSILGKVPKFETTDPNDVTTAKFVAEKQQFLMDSLNKIKEEQKQKEIYERAITYANDLSKNIGEQSQQGWLKIDKDRPWYDTVADWAAIGAASQVEIVGTSIATGPTFALSMMGTTSGLQEYMQAKDAGVTQGQALRIGFITGILEAVFEQKELEGLLQATGTPLKKLLPNLPHWLDNAGYEGLSELLTTFSQNVNKLQYDVESQEAMGKLADKGEILPLTKKLFEGGLQSFVGGSFAGGLTSAILGDPSVDPDKAPEIQKQRENPVAKDFNYVPAQVSANPEQAALDAKNGVKPQGYWQLKAGKEATSDHVRFLLANNFGMDDATASIGAVIHERLERALNLKPGEGISKIGISLGSVQEQPTGFEYNFKSIDPDGPRGTFIKQEDGTYLGKTFDKDGTLIGEEVIQPENLQKAAASFVAGGMKPDTFMYSIGDKALTNLLSADKGSPANVFGAVLLDKKNQAIKLWDAAWKEVMGETVVRPRHSTSNSAGLTSPMVEKNDSGTLDVEKARQRLFQVNAQMKRETGWFKDLDGRWKFELVDPNSTKIVLKKEFLNKLMTKGIKSKTTYYVDELFDLDNLSKVYPSLFDKENKDKLLVTINPELNLGEGAYLESQKEITIGTKLNQDESVDLDKLAEVMRHELQHAIQGIESFARGGDLEVAENQAKSNPDRYDKFLQKSEKILVRQADESDVDYRIRVKRNAHYYLYRALAGEMEANQAKLQAINQAFMSGSNNLTPLQREAMVLGINKNDILFTYHNKALFSSLLNEVFNKEQLASVTMLHTGEKLIQVFEKGNFPALLHEYGHVILTLLNDEQIKVVAEWAKTDKKTTQSIVDLFTKRRKGLELTKQETAEYKRIHEMFAHTFEEYFLKGKAPNAGLKKVFAYAKQVLTDFYMAHVKVPGSKLTPEIKAVFDQMLMSDSEKFGGTIAVPGAKLATDQGFVDMADSLYTIENSKGKAVVKLFAGKGKTIEVNVENIIRGERMTDEQVRVFGRDAKWQSPYEFQAKTSDMLNKPYQRKYPIPLKMLSTFDEPTLHMIAARLGMGRRAKLYPMKTLIEIIHSKMQAEAIAARPNATVDEMEDSMMYGLGESEEFYSVRPSGTVSPSYTTYPETKELDKISTIVKGWSAWTLDCVRDAGGKGILSNFFYQKGLRSTAFTKTTLGELHKLAHDVQKLVRIGGRFQPGYNELMQGTDTVYGHVTQLTAQLNTDYAHLQVPISPEAQRIVDAMKLLLDKHVEIAMRNKMAIQIGEGKDATYIPFTGKGNAPRSYTEDFWRILTDDDPRMRRQLQLAIQELNPTMTFSTIEKIVQTMSDHARTNKKLYLESQRQIPVMPTHIKSFRGGLLEIMHVEPFEYVSAINMKFALRVGFFSEFSQPVDKNPAIRYVNQKTLDGYIKDFESDTTVKAPLERLFSALNGVPLSDKYTISPSNVMYKPYRALTAFMMIKKSLLLSTSWIVNRIEPSIKTPAMYGWGRHGRAAWDFASTTVQHEVYKLANHLTLHQIPLFQTLIDHDSYTLMREQMLRAGTLNEHLVRFTINKKDALRDMARTMSTMINKTFGTTAAIDFGDFYGSWVAHIMAEDLRMGKGSKWDVERLRVVGFEESEIPKIIAGKADKTVYDTLPQRMVTTQFGTSTLPAERSQWHNWRHAGDVISFDRYCATHYRYMNQLLRAQYLGRTGKPTSQYVGMRKYLDNVLTMAGGLLPGKHFSPATATLAFTIPAAGIVAMGARQLLLYGVKGMLMGWDEDRKDETEAEAAARYAKMVLDGYASSSLSGFPAQAYQSWRKGEISPMDFLLGMSLSANAIMELIHFGNSLTEGLPGHLYIPESRYNGKSFWVKSRMLFEANVPATKGITTWLAVLGHGNKDYEYEAANQIANKWLQQHGQHRGTGGSYTEGNEDYFKYMSLAFQEMKNMERKYSESGERLVQVGKNEDFTRISYYVERALQEPFTGKTDETEAEKRARVAAFWQARKIMPRFNEANKALFLKHFQGTKTLGKIREWDESLDFLANYIKYGN